MFEPLKFDCICQYIVRSSVLIHFFLYQRALVCNRNLLFPLQIERLQNQSLYTQYAAKRKQMIQQNSHRNDNERMLWHGTSAGPIDSINAHGFNRSYCGGTIHHIFRKTTPCRICEPKRVVWLIKSRIMQSELRKLRKYCSKARIFPIWLVC